MKGKVFLLSFFLLAGGVVLGMILTSHIGLVPPGGALSEQKETKKVDISLPPGNLPSFVEVARSATPAVVNISTTRVIRGGEGFPLTPFFEDPFFRRFFGDEFLRPFGVPRERKEQSLGSGVVVDPEGYIITNNHVISQADEIKVLLANEREFKGKVVGSDPKTDIAIVKIDASDLPTITWGDSSQLQVGEYVLAIGNPFGLNQTVTMGIISAVGRAQVGIADYEDFIQTDAAINPGNSGGALVNARGELIGINTAIFSRSGGYMGIGFAVPSNMARSVMESLLKSGKVIRGWLGVSIQGVTPQLAKEFGLKEGKGAVVSEVLSGSPADRAGIERGDVIIQYGGRPVDNPSQLRNLVAQTPVGSKVAIRIIRNKKEKVIDVVITEQPKEVAQDAEETEEGLSHVLSGVRVSDITPEMSRRLGLSKEDRGVVVTDVESGSIAEESGLRRGDLILEINRESVRSREDYNRIVSQLSEDDSVLLLISREGRAFFLTVGSSS